MFKQLLMALGRALITPAKETTSSNFGAPDAQFIDVEIQLQDDTGNWRTYHVTRNIPPMIIASERQLASQFPGRRVRAVDNNGRIVDIL